MPDKCDRCSGKDGELPYVYHTKQDCPRRKKVRCNVFNIEDARIKKKARQDES